MQTQPYSKAPFTLSDLARIVRRSPGSPRIVLVHHNACPALAEQGACRCDAEWRIVKARAK